MKKISKVIEKRQIKDLDKMFARFKKLCKPFLNWKGEFSIGRYQSFFIKGNSKDITKFYSEANKLVMDLILFVSHIPKNYIPYVEYHFDLIVLLCSDLNIKLRSLSIDQSRACVDVTKFLPEEVFGEMAHVMKTFKKPHTLPLVAPCDYCKLYNVADYIIPIFDLENRRFDLPHIYEMKTMLPTTVVDSKMQKRMDKQRERMKKIVTEFDKHLNLFGVFMFNEGYLESHKKELFKMLKKKKDGELKIDSVQSLLTSKAKLSNDQDYWYINITEEIGCGVILPMIFRNFPLNFLKKLVKSERCLYIKIHKKGFKSAVKEWDSVKKIDKHHSIYHAYVRFKDGGSISIANLIHMKFEITKLKDILENIKKYSYEHHGSYKNYDILQHENTE